MNTTISKQDETLDNIVHRIYGNNPQMLHAVTNANPRALVMGVNLPSGLVINLPPIETQVKTHTTINLWD